MMLLTLCTNFSNKSTVTGLGTYGNSDCLAFRNQTAIFKKTK